MATPSLTGKENDDVHAFTLLIKRGIQSSLIGNDIQEYTPCRPPWQKKITVCQFRDYNFSAFKQTNSVCTHKTHPERAKKHAYKVHSDFLLREIIYQ